MKIEQLKNQKLKIETLKIETLKKTRENHQKINVISIALNLTNSTQWKLR